MRNKVLSTVIKVATLILVLCTVYTLVSLQGKISQQEQRAGELQREITATEQEKQQIQEKIDAADTDEGVKQIARDKLGLAGAGEIVFQDVGN